MKIGARVFPLTGPRPSTSSSRPWPVLLAAFSSRARSAWSGQMYGLGWWIGEARGRREGGDVVLVSYGGSVAETLKAADALQEQGVSATVIDLRSLQPWDRDTVLEAVARIGRVVLVSEAPLTGGFISEVAATIAEEVLDALLAPPARVAGFDTPYPYAQDRAYLPGTNRILRAVQGVLDY